MSGQASIFGQTWPNWEWVKGQLISALNFFVDSWGLPVGFLNNDITY